jgi:internalin A
LLTWLTDLDVAKNLISEVPEFIGHLPKLEHLNLSYNPIHVLPESLSRLTKLEFLAISDAKPSAADPVIGRLTSLRRLILRNTGLKEFPGWILNLTNLTGLSLEHNHLKVVPDSISKLSHLDILNLANNDLKQLPPSLRSLKSLTMLWIDGNLGIPNEISTGGDARTILDFYFRLKGQRQPLNEFKLILVGRGGVGKTTLVHRLTTGQYKEFKRTPGINITKWSVQVDNDQVQAHIWDFGGQEIMHGTHRFFMTERALYLILLSGREGTEDHDAEYWLSLVRSFAGDVPRIILLNKWDDYQFELNRQLLIE